MLALPVLVAGYVLLVRGRRRRLARFADEQTLHRLIPDASPRRLLTKFVIFLSAVGLLVVAVARPQTGARLKEVTQEGIEIMFAVDVSNSMLATDFEPSRLERTKFAITRMLENLSQDRVGLIVFAGDAYVQLPITADYVAARNFVRQVSPTMVSRQGTAIGAAIDLAAASFSSQSEGSRAIILISDGENHEDNALGAAQSAAEKGIKIYTIGIGTPEGAPISIGGDFIRDRDGNIVVTKLDEKVLEEIALTTGGAYIRATARSMGLEEIIERVNQTEKSKFKAEIFDQYNEQFQYFVGAAILLLLFEGLIISRKNRLLARFNIFGRDSGTVSGVRK